jgi:hypothetical protein
MLRDILGFFQTFLVNEHDETVLIKKIICASTNFAQQHQCFTSVVTYFSSHLDNFEVKRFW